MGWVTTGAMRRAIAVTTVAASLVGCGLLRYGGWELLLLGALCVVFAFLYTAGPFPLAYHGWGDLLVLLFFGLVPVGGTYYVMAHGLTRWILPVAGACGLVVDTLLLVNNYRDRAEDARSGQTHVGGASGGCGRAAGSTCGPVSGPAFSASRWPCAAPGLLPCSRQPISRPM